jgi:hypothetical protein
VGNDKAGYTPGLVPGEKIKKRDRRAGRNQFPIVPHLRKKCARDAATRQVLLKN